MTFTSVIFLILALTSSLVAKSAYPAHWWTPINDPAVPGWEILPQAASQEKNEVIISKRNELGIMSNFAATPIVMQGTTYASIEGLWQSMKIPESPSDPRYKNAARWPLTRVAVENMTAFEALKAGKEAEKIMKADGVTWVSFRGYKIEYKGKDAHIYYDIIEAATRAKIDQNPEVKTTLLATGNLTLRPDHHEDKDGTKAWKYYEIYMKLRAELQKYPNKNLYNDDWFKTFSEKYKLPKI